MTSKVFVSFSGQRIIGFDKKPFNGSKEFINKEILLEYLQKERNAAKIMDFDDFGKGELTILNQIIEEIESL